MARSVMIVDDHAAFRTRATELLEAAGYQVVGACPDGRSALEAIAETRPDVVLLDVQLPDIDGFGVLARLDAQPEPPVGRPVDRPSSRPIVVLISTREAVDYGGRVARSGAAGFITKSELSADSLGRVVGP